MSIHSTHNSGTQLNSSRSFIYYLLYINSYKCVYTPLLIHIYITQSIVFFLCFTHAISPCLFAFFRWTEATNTWRRKKRTVVCCGVSLSLYVYVYVSRHVFVHNCVRLSADCCLCIVSRRTVVCACEWIGKVEEGRFIAVISVLFRHSDSRTDRASTRFRISTSKFAVVFHTTQKFNKKTKQILEVYNTHKNFYHREKRKFKRRDKSIYPQKKNPWNRRKLENQILLYFIVSIIFRRQFIRNIK